MDKEPDWVPRLRAAVYAFADDRDPPLAKWAPPPADARPAAVLVVLAGSEETPDVLLLERAVTLRTHAGQMAFPGGAIDPTDSDAVAAALREASEEVGLLPATVQIIGQLPAIWVPPSNFAVTSVLAHWHDPHPLHAHDEEVVRITRINLTALADPHHRYRIRLASGQYGAAFHSGSHLVWGFTAGVLDLVLRLGGWALPWDHSRILPRP